MSLCQAHPFGSAFLTALLAPAASSRLRRALAILLPLEMLPVFQCRSPFAEPGNCREEKP